MNDGFQIAIDGPVAAGKSTVARKLAEVLNFVYVDTGAVYRALTLAAIARDVDEKDEEALVDLAREIDIDVRLPFPEERDGRQSTVLVNGRDVSWEIRTREVTASVPVVASLPKVREVLVTLQQKIAENKNVVMEGRDITYVVLPDAEIKIYLDATEEERVDRYFKGRRAQERGMSKEQVREWLQDRDEMDRTRETSPLKVVPGVWQIDSTGMSIDEVVEIVARKVDEQKG